MQSIWWRRALQQRFGALAAAALILWTLGMAAAASVATLAPVFTLRRTLLWSSILALGFAVLAA
jgi:hypothetical protein